MADYLRELENYPEQKKRIKLLVVDDHPMIIKGCELSLMNYTQYEWDIFGTGKCTQAMSFLKRSGNAPFQAVLLDINLSQSSQEISANGEDLGMVIKKLYPKVKIIVWTTVSDPLRLKNILKNLNPDGFVMKRELTSELLLNSIEEVLRGRKYYCKYVKKLAIFEIAKDEEITDIDRMILYFISIGEKMKNLPKLIPLSMASIERRKKHIKIIFDIPEGSNRELIRQARKKGYL